MIGSGALGTSQLGGGDEFVSLITASGSSSVAGVAAGVVVYGASASGVSSASGTAAASAVIYVATAAGSSSTTGVGNGLTSINASAAGISSAIGLAHTSATSALGHELAWIYATPTGVLQANELTQFLDLHGVTVIAQGTPVVTVSGGLATWQTLGEVDQPFTAPANIGWLRIPLSSTNLAPTNENGWSNASPITVSIYTDASGVPGTLVASTVLPAEQIEAVQLVTWPEPDDLLFGPAATDVQASLPQLPGSGWAGITSLVAGSWGIIFATQSPNDTEMWVSPFDGSDLGGWFAGSTLPVSGIAQSVYAPTSQAVVILSGGLMWAAPFSQTGVVGSWQALPIIAGFGSGMIGILTYEGVDYLVAMAASGITYYAVLSSSASFSSWTSGPVFPISFTPGVAYQVGDHLVMIVQSSGLATLVSLYEPGGRWIVSGTLTASSSVILGVIGFSVVTTNGTAINATILTELGTASWSLPVPLSASGSSVSLLAFASGTGYVAFWIPTTSGVDGWQQSVHVPSWVNVPLPQSLTSGATYHLVLSATNALTVGVAVPVVTPSSGPTGHLWNGSSWVALGGAIPFVAFYAASGAPLALVGIGKTTVVWFDTPSGALTSATELVGNTSNSRVVFYAGGVLSEVN